MEPLVTATVTFPNWDDEAPSMRQDIVAKAAEILIQDDKYRGEIVDLIKSKVEDRVTELVNEVFEQGVQKTDWRGQPEGEPFLVSEMIQRSAKDWLDVQVNNKGKTPDRYERHTMTRFEYLVRKLYREDFDKAFEGRVRQAVEAIKGHINDKIEADIKAYLRGVIAQ